MIRKSILPILMLPLSAVNASTLTYTYGQQTDLNISNFNEVTQLYKIVEGEERYAIIAYEQELENLSATSTSNLNFDVSGFIEAAWFSSNFIMKLSLLCDDKLIAEDTYEGVRYNRVSYLIKPFISLQNHPVSGGCKKLKIRLDKIGSFTKKFYTRIDKINISVYITQDF